MTLPHEEALAIVNTKEFLFDLMNPKKTPRIPKAIRQKARALLKHYPLVAKVWKNPLENINE